MSQLTRHATFFVRTVKCGFLSDSSTPKGRPMERAVITAVADLRCRHVDLSKSQLETMALLTVGMIGAQMVSADVRRVRGEWHGPCGAASLGPAWAGDAAVHCSPCAACGAEPPVERGQGTLGGAWDTGTASPVANGLDAASGLWWSDLKGGGSRQNCQMATYAFVFLYQIIG
jgi:hypothetical protein